MATIGLDMLYYAPITEDENGDEFLEEIQDEMEYEQISDILMAKVEEKFDVEYFEPEQ